MTDVKEDGRNKQKIIDKKIITESQNQGWRRKRVREGCRMKYGAKKSEKESRTKYSGAD